MADNLRNERRYPHLSQRVSTSNPPLPPRSDSVGACVDTDEVKLRVSMNGKSRPESSQYADVDDLEDRYTTLKSLGKDKTNIFFQIGYVVLYFIFMNTAKYG